jgi:protein-tyrosine phosphatase
VPPPPSPSRPPSAKIRGVIDLHTHVLPAIDDGPADMAGSVAVAEVAAHGGIRTLVATPHLRADHPGVRPRELAGRVADLGRRLHEHGLPVEVLSGAEVDLDAAAALSDEELALATLAANGRDLLVETPYGPLPEDFAARLLALAGRGFRLTLAHPERNPTFQSDPARVGTLVEQGLLVQLTARSVAGRRTPAAATARTLLGHGWAHVLASDAHAVDRRPPDLGSALRHAGDALPDLRAELHWMVTDAPRAILEGRPLPARPPRAEPKRRRRLLRRS